MRRLVVFLTAVCSLAVGAWALPAGQASPAVEHVGADAELSPPTVTLPEIVEADVAHSGPAASGQSAAGLEIREILPAHDAGPADHLAPAVQEVAVPAAIVTTTLPPTTLPPTTVPSTTVPSAPTPDPVATVAFTAQQAYGSCGEDVPYDIFSGTATPGSTVTISSPYGSGSATADAGGHWERTVEFPTAPRGQTFEVNVGGVGGSATLHFTATGGSHGA